MRHMHVKDILNGVAAVAAGAAAMYLLDPRLGRQRRALLREKMEARRHDVEDFARSKSRRLAGRLRGTLAEAQSNIGSPEPVSDQQLTDRVRSQLGRLVSRPGAIDVTAADGCVSLSGHIVTAEHDKLLSEISAMDGVTSVDDRLAVYDQPGNIPELQGAGRAGRTPY